jgi:protein tyrosine/serine phosphatase
MTEESAPAAFDPGALPEHFNLRDLGGLPVAGGGRTRFGRLFRGASLHRLEGEDLALVDRLGFRLAIDLRTGSEVARGVFAAGAAATRHLPIFEVGPVFEEPIEDIGATLAETYAWMLEEGRGSIAAILELLAQPDSYPAVVYCAAGKDRTGTVCALVLRLVGVEPETIVADYERSDRPAAALRRHRAELAPGREDPVPAGIYRAPGEAMRAFLRRLDDDYGSAEGYLEAIGSGVAEIKAGLVAQLVARN